MNDSIYRKVSIERLSSPEQIDQLLKIRSPSGWIVVISVLILLGIGCGWLILGKIPNTVQCNGNIMPVKGLAEIQSVNTFLIDKVYVHAGMEIHQNDILIDGKTADNQSEYCIKSPYDGIVTDVYIKEGILAIQGKTLIRIEPIIKSSVNDLCAEMYISIEDGVLLEGGEEAFISPAGISLDHYGYIKGSVESISRYPDNENQRMCVRILFTPSEKNGKIEYTYGREPLEELHGGTPCSGYILLGYQSPLEMLIPWLVSNE